MATHKDNFHKRVAEENQVAEKACEEYFKGKGYLHRFGWGEELETNTLIQDLFYNLPDPLKRMPDYILNQDGKVMFIECKGYAGKCKLKKKDYIPYRDYWNKFGIPFYIFTYDCPNKSPQLITLDKIIYNIVIEDCDVLH